MSIIAEPFVIDWKIDLGSTNQHILRVCTNGRWKTEATIERIDDEWQWENGEQVVCLGECREKDAIDYLWNNRGAGYPGVHHYLCECVACMAEKEAR